MPGLPKRTPFDREDLLGSATTFWSANRAASALVVTLIMATLSLALAAGGFDVRAAAAGVPGTEGPNESDGPQQIDGSEGPSFEPIPSESPS
jgi:hypothetical protein